MEVVLGILLYILGIVLSLTVAVVFGLIIYARWNYGTLEKCGIPVVKPHFYLGSNPNAHNEKSHWVDVERAKTYGKIYGVYEAREPTIYISDPKILRIILSRDFEHFASHRHMAMGDEHPVMAEVTDFLEGEKWKTVRSTLTPHFTTGKIRQMSETISEIAKEYVKALIKDNPGKKVIEMEFRKYAPPLVLEIIGKCFCGINIENARDPDNKLVEALKLAMGGDFISFDSTFTYVAAFPFLARFYPSFPNGGLATFDNIMRGIVKGRQESNVQKQDMVNTIVEMFRKAKTDPEYRRLGITDKTAVAQAFEFFLASYEGVRTTLSWFTYYVAVTPGIQERILDEIDAALAKTPGKITSETVADLPFLTSCFSETLRIAPSFIRLDRRCTKDWEHDGIRIKKGTAIVIPQWALQRDPEQFPDPETFNPDRFMPGNKEKIDPYSINSFGQGPRACIGQRFTFEMFKIVMVHYLKEFRIEKRPDTVFRDKPGNPFFVVHDPIVVNFVKRI